MRLSARTLLTFVHKLYSRRMIVLIMFGILALLAAYSPDAPALAAPYSVTDICPGTGIAAWTAEFEPDGIVLASFDRASMWVYNIGNNARYPLPDTYPCGANCRLSPDSQWVTFLNSQNSAYGKMRLDGTERTDLVLYANDVEWWNPDTLLVWTPGHEAYLQPESDNANREYLSVNSVLSIQPGGRWGLAIEQEGDDFTRYLSNLETRGLQGIAEQRIPLGVALPYFDAAAWSPDGASLAYVASGPFDDSVSNWGSEIWGIRPADNPPTPTQWTHLYDTYGASRINGRAVGQLSWSPNSTRIAFWVIELIGPDVVGNTGNATIHVLNIATGDVQKYCGYSTTEHSPNPPRIVWSPDSTHLAFGGNVPGDDKGYLLLALDTTTGVFTELSNGIYPAYGTADPVAWGLPPT